MTLTKTNRILSSLLIVFVGIKLFYDFEWLGTWVELLFALFCSVTIGLIFYEVGQIKGMLGVNFDDSDPIEHLLAIGFSWLAITGPVSYWCYKVIIVGLLSTAN